MKNKELHEKIEKAMASLDHIQRAEANPFLFTRVMEKMKSPVKSIVQPVLAWRIVAGMAIVIGLNLWIGFYSSHQNTASPTPAESAYFNNHLYSY
jgi:hypothetical protein